MRDYVGIPYVERGTTLAGLDCYGLVRLVLLEQKQIILPEQPPLAATWHRYVKVIRSPTDIRPFDVLMFSGFITGLADHIGIMISHTDFVHTGAAFGSSVCEPLDRYRHCLLAIGRPI